MATTKRSEQTREAQKRDVWKPHAMLDTPEPPEGYAYRWIRHEIRGNDDATNVIGRMREGYEPVRADELPEGWVASVASDGKHAGVVRNGDLILCKIPVEKRTQRQEYYRERARRQQEAVDLQLQRHQNQAMPISKEQKSRVTRGQPDFEE